MESHRLSDSGSRQISMAPGADDMMTEQQEGVGFGFSQAGAHNATGQIDFASTGQGVEEGRKVDGEDAFGHQELSDGKME